MSSVIGNGHPRVAFECKSWIKRQDMTPKNEKTIMDVWSRSIGPVPCTFGMHFLKIDVICN